MPRTTKKQEAAQGRFLAALTATDQLTATERKRTENEGRQNARKQLRSQIYEARMQAEASFHWAQAACKLACCARVLDREDKEALSRSARVAARSLIDAADRLMSLPMRSNEDRRERNALIKQWRSAGLETRAHWLAAEARWQERIAQPTMQEGC